MSSSRQNPPPPAGSASTGGGSGTPTTGGGSRTPNTGGGSGTPNTGGRSGTPNTGARTTTLSATNVATVAINGQSVRLSGINPVRRTPQGTVVVETESGPLEVQSGSTVISLNRSDLSTVAPLSPEFFQQIQALVAQANITNPNGTVNIYLDSDSDDEYDDDDDDDDDVGRSDPDSDDDEDEDMPLYNPPLPLKEQLPAVGTGADGAGRTSEFVDMHKVVPLEMKEYLPEELVKNWKEIFSTDGVSEDYIFHETKTYFKARKGLWYRGWATISGSIGDGKTAMARHLATAFARVPHTPRSNSEPWQQERYMQNAVDEQGRPSFTIVHVNSPEDWRTLVKPDENQVVWIDDIFGPGAYAVSRVEPWYPLLDEILITATQSKQKLLVLITVHNHQLDHLPDEIRFHELFHPRTIYNLNDYYMKPSGEDRKCVLKQNVRGLSYRDTDELLYFNMNDSFPLACRLYGSVHSFHMEGHMFFQNPWRYMENAIDKVYRFDKVTYFTLAVAVFMDGAIELDKYSVEEYSPHGQNVFKHLLRELDVPPETDLSMMRSAATLLNGTFFTGTKKFCWKFHHERILHLVAQSVARKISIKKMVELCTLDFFIDRIRSSNYFGSTNESVISCYMMDYEAVAQRFTYEILSGNVKLMASHATSGDEKFIDAWFKFMTDIGSLQAVIQQWDSSGRTLFYWACYYGRDPLVQRILENPLLEEFRADPRFVEQLPWCLQASCQHFSKTHPKVVKLLLDAGVDVNARDDYRGEDAVELFGKEVAYMIKVEARPVHFAACRGHQDTMQLLLEKGADAKTPTTDGMTPLHWSASRKSGESKYVTRGIGDHAQFLIDKGADVNAQTPDGRTAMHLAVAGGHLQIIQILKNAGVDVKQGTMEDGRSFMSVAAATGRRDLAEYLQKEGASLDGIVGKSAWAPLTVAVGMDNKEMAEFFIDKGARVTSQGTGGWTALHFAVLFHNNELIGKLLEKGADPNASTHTGMTPLHVAAKEGYIDCCNFLLEYGAKPEAKTYMGETPVTLAAKAGSSAHAIICALLIREGVETEGPSNRHGRDMDFGMDPMMMMMMGMRRPGMRDMMFH